MVSNSKIPDLAREKINSRVIDSEESDQTSEHHQSLLSSTISSISSNGTAIGFASGLVALCISLIPVTSRNGDLEVLRSSIATSAAWWAVFTIRRSTSHLPSDSNKLIRSLILILGIGLAAAWLLPPKTLTKTKTQIRCSSLLKSWNHLFKMISDWKKLQHTSLYLLAWCLLSNGERGLLASMSSYTHHFNTHPSSPSLSCRLCYLDLSPHHAW